jgi:hypothetical protein
MSCSNFNAEAFLRAFGRAPEALSAEGSHFPLLHGIAALSSARPSALPLAQAGKLGSRLNRRYLRIRAVQDALGKLNFNKAKPGTALNDFVFEQTDFSLYKKIAAEDFSLFDTGLADFDDDFFTENFGVGREKTAALIASAYKRIGAFYYLNRESHLHNPLLMALMRNLHTSLAFRPVITGKELLAEFTGAFRRPVAPGDFAVVYYEFLKLLDGSAVSHADGMITLLVVEPKAGPGMGAAFTDSGKGPALKGIFHPRGKAYTLHLA